MLFNYIYLLKGNYQVISTLKSEQPVQVIVPVEAKDLLTSPSSFRLLHNTKNDFCFLLTESFLDKATATPHNNQFLACIRFLFLPNYIRQEGRHVFFAEVTEQQKQDVFEEKVDRFLEQLTKQGIHNALVEIIPNKFEDTKLKNGKLSVSNTEMNNLVASGETAIDLEVFSRKVLSPAALTKRWVISVDSADDLEAKMRLAQHFEGWLGNSNPLLVNVIETVKELDSQRTKLAIDNKLLQDKLANSASYLKLLKENAQWYVSDHSRLTLELQKYASSSFTQATAPTLPVIHSSPDSKGQLLQLQQQIEIERKRGDNILEWYKKEYEILPGWYKKMGHLIKAATGKRSFKSLFK